MATSPRRPTPRYSARRCSAFRRTTTTPNSANSRTLSARASPPLNLWWKRNLPAAAEAAVAAVAVDAAVKENEHPPALTTRHVCLAPPHRFPDRDFDSPDFRRDSRSGAPRHLGRPGKIHPQLLGL